MIPQKLPLTPFTEGDQWDGIPAIAIKVGPVGGPFVAPASNLTLVTMRFKKAGSVPSDVVELSSDDAEINITNAENWEIEIPAQIIAGLTFGKWIWRIRCTDAAGAPQTYLADEITVLETI